MNKSDVQETLVHLYLRLNGYFISGFIAHAEYGNRTEIDVLGVRFPRHREARREVVCDPYLKVSTDRVDFIIGEVKGGNRNISFNPKFRNNDESIRDVLHRIGNFDDNEIKELADWIPSVLEPENIRVTQNFPMLEVQRTNAQVRFILFAMEQERSQDQSRPYIFGNDVMNFIWKCLHSDSRRERCDVKYNYELWGTQFLGIVKYFKHPERTNAGTVQDICKHLQLQQS